MVVGIALALIGLLLLVMQTKPHAPAATVTESPLTAGPAIPQLPGQLPQETKPGLLKLDDFQIVLPAGWQRRKDWEDPGPGTKLFLLGPKAGTVQLVIGIDVYPLRGGTTLEQFSKQYSQKWDPALLTQRPAFCCGQKAQMLALNENGLEKLYLLTVSGEKGFAVGMIGPAGSTTANTQAFRRVVDTIQLYK